MANRRDFFYRQKVTEAELDAAFTELEQAERYITSDLGLIGVAVGYVVAQQASPNLTVQVSGPGVVYDQTGQRVAIPSTQNVNCAVDEGALSTAVIGGANSRILSIFVEFDRTLTDPRTDGNSATVYFDRAEGFQFNVVAGEELPSPVPPPLRSDQILLADVTLVFGQTQILTADISTARREWMFKTTGTVIAVGQVEEALQALATAITTRVAKAGDTMTGPLQMAANQIIELMNGTGEVTYEDPRDRTIMLSLMSGQSHVSGAGALFWGLLVAGAVPYWWSFNPVGYLYFPLNQILRDGMAINGVDVLVDPAGAESTDASQMQLSLVYIAQDFTPALAVANEVVVASVLDDETGALQLLSLASLGHAVVRSTRDYYLRIRPQVAGGDQLYGLRLSVTDPGPRNF